MTEEEKQKYITQGYLESPYRLIAKSIERLVNLTIQNPFNPTSDHIKDYCISEATKTMQMIEQDRWKHKVQQLYDENRKLRYKLEDLIDWIDYNKIGKACGLEKVKVVQMIVADDLLDFLKTL